MALKKLAMAKLLCNQLNISKKKGTDLVESFFDIIKSEL